MRSLVLTLIIFGSIPVILVKPQVGVLMWSWISYMNPHRLTWGFAYEAPFAFIVGAATILAWLISREPKRLPWNGVTALLIAFTLWVSLTTLFATIPEAAQAKWELSIKILLFNGFVTLGLMGSRKRLDALVWVIVISLGFYGIRGGLFTIWTGGNYRVWGPADSFIGDNNALGLALLMVIPLMRYLQLSAQAWWLRWGLGASMALTVIAVLGTHSRGALVGLAAMLAALIVKSPRRLLIGFGLGLVLFASIDFMPEAWRAHMETIATYEEEASMQSRIRAWAYAVDVATENPFLGGGFGVFLGNKEPTSKLGWLNAHSIYFEVLGEHGFVGLALFLMLGIATIRTAAFIIRHARDRPDDRWAADLARMIQVSLVGYAVAGAFANLAFFDLVYHLIVIVSLMSAVIRQPSIVSDKFGRSAERLPSSAGSAASRPAPETEGGRMHG